MLTPFQLAILRITAPNRAPDSHAAGGAVLNAAYGRYSGDLDIFHDREAAVVQHAEADMALLRQAGYQVRVILSRPSHIQAVIAKDVAETRIDWTLNSVWRFFPTVPDRLFGWRLHDVDLAVNKLLALAGRREPRDLMDVVEADARGLYLDALAWAAPGIDPGFNPTMVLEEVARNARVLTPERLGLEIASATAFDPVLLKQKLLLLLRQAETAFEIFPVDSVGCICLDAERRLQRPDAAARQAGQQIWHRAQSGGAWPSFS